MLLLLSLRATIENFIAPSIFKSDISRSTKSRWENRFVKLIPVFIKQPQS